MSVGSDERTGGPGGRDDAATADAEMVLVCRVGDHRFALPVADVVELHRAVEVAPLPSAPEGILGVVDVRGTLVPVLDLRRRLGLGRAAAPAPSDVLVAVEVHERPLLLVVDTATGIERIPADRLRSGDEVVPGARYVRDVAGTPDGPLVISDLAAFLSSDDLTALDRALRERAAAGEEERDG